MVEPHRFIVVYALKETVPNRKLATHDSHDKFLLFIFCLRLRRPR
jgi:hypothetical protein